MLNGYGGCEEGTWMMVGRGMLVEFQLTSFRWPLQDLTVSASEVLEFQVSTMFQIRV